jgi:hypothetical protein
MFHIERGLGRIEVRFAPDPALVENFVQILAHVLIQENIVDAYPLLAVSRELVRQSMAAAAAGGAAEVHACIERVRDSLWRVTVDSGADGLLCGAADPTALPGLQGLAHDVHRSPDGHAVSVDVDCSRRGTGSHAPPGRLRARRLAHHGGRQ